MVGGDLQVGDLADNIVGDLAALSSAAGFAFYAAIVRSAPDRDWSPVLPGYGVMMIVICCTVTLANGNTVVPPAPDIGLALVHGGGVHRRRHADLQHRFAAHPGGSDDGVRPDRDGAGAGVGVPAAVRDTRPRARCSAARSSSSPSWAWPCSTPATSPHRSPHRRLTVIWRLGTRCATRRHR